MLSEYFVSILYLDKSHQNDICRVRFVCRYARRNVWTYSVFTELRYNLVAIILVIKICAVMVAIMVGLACDDCQKLRVGEFDYGIV